MATTILPASFYQTCLGHYADLGTSDFVIKNIIPVPYFGDLLAYLASPLRVITVALNPSNIEFVNGQRARFDLNHGISGPAGLEYELSNYFKVNPYKRWFTAFENVLSGLDASYGGLQAIGSYTSTAVHVDMCSPIATRPTWSYLTAAQKSVLAQKGRLIFDEIIEALKPEIIIASVGWNNIKDWNPEYANGPFWPSCISYDETKDGKKMRSVLRVQTQKMKTAGGHNYLFTNASAANIPYGRFSDNRKIAAGAMLKDVLQNM